jgi:hypothetical protein
VLLLVLTSCCGTNKDKKDSIKKQILSEQKLASNTDAMKQIHPNIYDKNSDELQEIGISDEKTQDILGDNDSELVFSLPINAMMAPGNRLHLLVEIPKGYKALHPLDSPFQEFIPLEDTDAFNWSEIITMIIKVGKSFSAQQSIDQLKYGITNHASDFEIISEYKKSYKHYEVAALIMKFNHDGKTQLSFAKSFAGPFDSSVISYAIIINDKMTIETAMAKIQKFMSSNLKVSKH